MHHGTQITEAEKFAYAIEKVAPLVLELKSKYGIKFFSIGGGLGIVYQSSFASGRSDWWTNRGRSKSEGKNMSKNKKEQSLSIQQYVDAILPPLRELKLQILLEPG